MARTLICLILAVLTAGNTFSQYYRNSQELFLEAEYFMLYEDYSDALPYYLELYEEYPGNMNLAHKIGRCYLNIPGRKKEAIPYLEDAANNAAADYTEGSIKQTTPPYIAWYDLATAYRINYQFDKAKETFRKYRESLLPDDTENIIFIDKQIEVCDNAKMLISQPVEFTEENMGEQFNDAFSNFHPLISGNGKTFTYMTALKFYDAVYFAQKDKERWSVPVNITPDIQSDGDLYISCLSYDGLSLYLSKVSNDDSDIYLSKFDGNKWSVARKMDKEINTRYWDTHAYITRDGSTIIFASDRPGGFGGLDLYISNKNSDGRWGPPRNLGPEINTAFNEDRPCISGDGNILYFCSQGHYNMGGFDLFKSEMLENGHWKNPENLGYPINTPDDNTFFMLVNNGKNAYISAFRDGGYGEEDIYYITFK